MHADHFLPPKKYRTSQKQRAYRRKRYANRSEEKKKHQDEVRKKWLEDRGSRIRALYLAAYQASSPTWKAYIAFYNKTKWRNATNTQKDKARAAHIESTAQRRFHEIYEASADEKAESWLTQLGVRAQQRARRRAYAVDQLRENVESESRGDVSPTSTG